MLQTVPVAIPVHHVPNGPGNPLFGAIRGRNLFTTNVVVLGGNSASSPHSFHLAFVCKASSLGSFSGFSIKAFENTGNYPQSSPTGQKGRSSGALSSAPETGATFLRGKLLAGTPGKRSTYSEARDLLPPISSSGLGRQNNSRDTQFGAEDGPRLK